MKADFLSTILLLSLTTTTFTQSLQLQQQFQLYAEHLGDFIPTQSFQFSLHPTQNHSFIYWPPDGTKTLRGMFYITSEDVDGLSVECQTGGIIQKKFVNKKIGVFSIPHNGQGEMKLIFKSEMKQLWIYLSYQFITNREKKPGEQLQNTTEINKYIQQFTKVRNTLIGQQQILKSIARSELRQTAKLQDQINTKTTRVIIQTVVLILSGLISIRMLKKQFKKGYQLIV